MDEFTFRVIGSTHTAHAVRVQVTDEIEFLVSLLFISRVCVTLRLSFTFSSLNLHPILFPAKWNLYLGQVFFQFRQNKLPCDTFYLKGSYDKQLQNPAEKSKRERCLSLWIKLSLSLSLSLFFTFHFEILNPTSRYFFFFLWCGCNVKANKMPKYTCRPQ